MLESRAFVALGATLVLMAGLYAVRSILTPGGAAIRGIAATTGSVVRVAGRPLRKTEVLGLLIFTLMAAIMFVVGAVLFCDWVAGAGSAGMSVDLGPIGGPGISGAVPTMPLVFGVEVVGGLSLIVVYMLSSARRSG